MVSGGGAIVTSTDGSGNIIKTATFTFSGVLKIKGSGNIKALVVGGGGGGDDFSGSWYGKYGGAGGRVNENLSYYVHGDSTVGTNFNVVVGNGGARNGDGGYSQFSTLTANGGAHGVASGGNGTQSAINGIYYGSNGGRGGDYDGRNRTLGGYYAGNGGIGGSGTSGDNGTNGYGAGGGGAGAHNGGGGGLGGTGGSGVVVLIFLMDDNSSSSSSSSLLKNSTSSKSSPSSNSSSSSSSSKSSPSSNSSSSSSSSSNSSSSNSSSSNSSSSTSSNSSSSNSSSSIIKYSSSSNSSSSTTKRRLSLWGQYLGFPTGYPDEYWSSTGNITAFSYGWLISSGKLFYVNTSSTYNSIERFGADSNWEDIASSGENRKTLGIRDGKLYYWGGVYGVCGNVPIGSSPVQIGSDVGWSKLSQSVAMKSGKIYQVNPDNSISQIIAFGDSRDSSWSDISCENGLCGSGYIGINNGQLWAWGDMGWNYYGQLGNNSSSSGAVGTTQIGSHNDWTFIDMNYSHTFGIRSGMLFSWGRNDNSELSLGDYNHRSSPVQVGSSIGWNYASCGNGYSLMINGTKLYSVGNNGYYTLGIGTTPSYVTSPVQVGSAFSWNYVCAGESFSMGIY